MEYMVVGFGVAICWTITTIVKYTFFKNVPNLASKALKSHNARKKATF